jgi:damage-control phosphatase, subfamily I
MKIQEECIDCSGKRTRYLLEGRAEPPIIKLIECSTRALFTEGAAKGECSIPHAAKRTELIRDLVHEDISREKKDKGIELMQKLAPSVLASLPSSGFERFKRLIRIAIAGNGLELDVPGNEIDILGLDFNALLNAELGIDDTERIYERVLKAKKIVYCCDNAPELVFDKMLIMHLVGLGKEVTAVVRSAPVQDDATLKEAAMIGLDKVCKVVPGPASIGVYLPFAEPFIRDLFASSDLIISKGMGNFEGLSETDLPIAYLLMAKCIPISRALGVKKGCGVAFLKHS